MAHQFRLAREKAGLPDDLVVLRKTRLRNSRPQHCWEFGGGDEDDGHKDVKTAMQYQHPELEIVRAALNQANGRVIEARA